MSEERTSKIICWEMRKKFNWAQNTPHAQAVVICSSIIGWASNVIDGCSKASRAAEFIAESNKQLELLAPYTEYSSWELDELRGKP